MPSFEKNFLKEKENIEALFRFLRGEDISGEKKNWDINVYKVQVKTWLRNGYLPLETWSVIEAKKVGWALQLPDKGISYFFRCPEKHKTVIIRCDEVYRFMLENKTENLEHILCKHCKKSFELSKFEGKGIRRQTIQYTPKIEYDRDEKIWPGGYHSAMIQVEPRVFHGIEMKEFRPELTVGME